MNISVFQFNFNKININKWGIIKIKKCSKFFFLIAVLKHLTLSLRFNAKMFQSGVIAFM